MTNEIEVKRRFWKELRDNPLLMVGLNGPDSHSLPMTPQLDKDADHCFWFYTTTQNRLTRGGRAMGHFASKGNLLFACIEGELVTETDSAVIDRYWSKDVEAWYEGGRSDPDLVMLRFDLGNAEIWLRDTGLAGAFKQFFGGDVHEERKDTHVEVSL